MSDPRSAETTLTTAGDYSDAETALGVLTACRQDLDAILAAIPPSKRGSRFTQATNSLSERIKVGEDLRKARHG